MPNLSEFSLVATALAQENVEGAADVGSIAWSSVGIGIIVLLAALVAALWQYRRWRQTRPPAEAARHEQKTRELYRHGEHTK